MRKIFKVIILYLCKAQRKPYKKGCLIILLCVYYYVDNLVRTVF